jgi:hypothetical protein
MYPAELAMPAMPKHSWPPSGHHLHSFTSVIAPPAILYSFSTFIHGRHSLHRPLHFQENYRYQVAVST